MLFQLFNFGLDNAFTYQHHERGYSYHEHIHQYAELVLLEEGELNVWVNGKPVSSNYKVKPLDIVQVLLDHEPHDYTIHPEDIPLNIVYEDDDVLVINKPAGMVVHPGHGNYEHTLLNALAYYFRDQLDINDPNIGLVHRIDKDTSGLLLIAKTPEAKTNLGQQFFNHTTERTYNALVWGTFAEDSKGKTIYEWYKNRNFADALIQELTSRGATVYLTRETDKDLSTTTVNRKRNDLYNRAKIINESNFFRYA